MTPVSRGRKKDGKAIARPARSEKQEAYAEAIREFLALTDESDAITAEIVASDLVGVEWLERLAGADGPYFTAELISYAKGTSTPAALALLRALQSVATTEDDRKAAELAGDELASKGVAEPAWGSSLSAVEPTECWLFADVFGDSASLICVFDRAGTQHGVVCLLSFEWGKTIAADLYPMLEPAETLEEMRERVAQSAGAVRVDSVQPAAASRLLIDGIETLDDEYGEEFEDSVASSRALVLARYRALPAAAPRPDPAAVPAETEISNTLEEFLRAAESLDATDPATRNCAELLVRFGYAFDPKQPRKSSPRKLLTFVEDFLPGRPELDEELAEILPWVLTAWTNWVIANEELPEGARAELVTVTEDLFAQLAVDDVEDDELSLFADEDDEDGEDDELDDLDEDEFGDEEPTVIDYYLDDVQEIPDVDTLRDILDRRAFAIPDHNVQIDDTIVELDPRDPEYRQTLIVAEHPELHEALTDPDFVGEINGVDPKVFLLGQEVVAEHLWHDEPMEVWAAVKRLKEKGQKRTEILAALGAAAIANGYVTDEEDAGEPDEVGYRAAVDGL
ncbi:hypothetical protein EV191_1011066 [Tamaricihabitans halophyticus]|uniref:Uncharacterized protein n=1 Tax=Tamaricihabitans halophyticus TaxID=1262583 RepID=A0A4R2R578_9PSEU|nr:hypothetical protein [Tamaricihabitans halophyticus]TCP57114.1 hypothetical protein EV191_1011066 [Tamaricihabitans halophyticus]